MKITNFKTVYPFRGYVIDSVDCAEERVEISLSRDGRFAHRCPGCGGRMARSRTTQQSFYDLPLGNSSVVVVNYPAEQGYCSPCGSYHTDRPQEAHPTMGATWRLMRYVSSLARFLPMDAMRAVCEVPPATAWRYDRAVLKEDLPAPDLDNIYALLVDEKQVRRGHGYVTLVLNAETGELLHLQEGKKATSLGAFFEKLTAGQKESIKAVCIDRAGAYKKAVGEWLPGAEIVYDRFHLMANLGAAIDEVRRAEQRGAERADRKAFKGQRFNLLRHPENLGDEEAITLRNLLDANENLSAAYVLKDQFRLAWTYAYAGNARKFLQGWIAMVRESGIEALIKFAEGVERDIEGIVAWCRHHITNGRIEGFNSIISRVVFKARGIRSIDYLWLKLRQESLLQT